MPQRQLRDVISLARHPERVLAGRTYQNLGIYSFGRGLFKKSALDSMSSQADLLYRVKANQFIYSRLFAFEGSYGMVTQEFDGFYVSNEYPTFDCDISAITPQYLNYYFKRPRVWAQVAEGSKGLGSRRQRVQPEQVLSHSLNLPSLEDQQRVVECLDAATAKVEEARRLRQQADTTTSQVLRGIIDSLMVAKAVDRQPLGDVLAEPLMNGMSIPAASLGAGIAFAKVGVVNSGIFDPREIKLADVLLEEDSPYWLRPGDLLISRGNTPSLVGSAAVYTGSPSKCAMPDLLIRARLNIALMDPQFLASFFQTREAREYIESESTGTSPSMKKISQPKLMKMPIPNLKISEQMRIVEALRAARDKIESLKRLQAETSAELDALLPSILERAFAGAL